MERIKKRDILRGTLHAARRGGSRACGTMKRMVSHGEEQDSEDSALGEAQNRGQRHAQSAASAAKRFNSKGYAAYKKTRQALKARGRVAAVRRAAAVRQAGGVLGTLKRVVMGLVNVIRKVKAAATALMAGGWLLAMLIILMCLVGFLLTSCFGIFFANEAAGESEYSLRTAIEAVNEDYQDTVDFYKNFYYNDEFQVRGARSTWQEFLAVYAVIATTDKNLDVVTMDSQKQEFFRQLYWKMNKIRIEKETKSEEVVIDTVDEDGNPTQSTVTQDRVYLYFYVDKKTPEEMADQYNFTQEQRQMLQELLAEDTKSLWMQAIYGTTGTGLEDMVVLALTQVGNIGGQPYWSWYGFGSRVEWCACFVSWVANECGYLDSGLIPRFAGCIQGSNWFKSRGLWQDGTFTPSPGQIIFFDWEGDGLTDHVGIVERVENGRVYTVEGNSGDMVRHNSYPLGSPVIYGYGTPML